VSLLCCGVPCHRSHVFIAPTHNLTLTRTAFELVELDEKLRDCHPGVKLIKLPLDLSSLPPPPKRKSAFLNTLSRLASPNGKSSATKTVNFSKAPIPALSSVAGTTIPSNGSSNMSSLLSSPSQELNDPFGLIMTQTEVFNMASPNNVVITGLAAYLTSIANDQIHRQTRVWKRFVRVRTDDLESVRVERAIKRVRSDLAAHLLHSSTDLSLPSAADFSREDGDTVIISTNAEEEQFQGRNEDEEQKRDSVEQDSVEPLESSTTSTSEANEVVNDAVAVGAATSKVAPEPPAHLDTSITVGEVEEDEVGPTPVQADVESSHTARIPRSQSADPTSRARVYKTSPLNGREETMSQTSQTTGDESSVSTSARRSTRKKRSQSADPNRELKKRSARKVVIDDFEMMRVLGKGCAGKVLLVRHKPTADLFALKAITKRHVLAHQELQHTLTEQAVLKRMAAEGKDPFVVKLWWSFHDRENLFLVMDFHPGGDLATQLARWGRLGRDRARFYAAEIVEGVEGLHANGVIYRDLKPENVLIGSDGHIVLTDFGLSKEFPRKAASITSPPTPNGQRGDYFAGASVSPSTKDKSQELTNGWPASPVETTSTFCGTAEYLAPEVIQGLPYSFEVDWWSFGTMLYEMLTGIVSCSLFSSLVVLSWLLLDAILGK
jgi:serum/glucocorticoid-regulated kinase 2